MPAHGSDSTMGPNCALARAEVSADTGGPNTTPEPSDVVTDGFRVTLVYAPGCAPTVAFKSEYGSSAPPPSPKVATEVPPTPDARTAVTTAVLLTNNICTWLFVTSCMALARSVPTNDCCSRLYVPGVNDWREVGMPAADAMLASTACEVVCRPSPEPILARYRVVSQSVPCTFTMASLPLNG